MANKKRNVSYVNQEEPAFLKQFKQRVGYKEGPTVDAKFQTPDFDGDDDAPEGEEDQPTVVVLKKGDLTAEQAAGVDGATVDDDEKDDSDDGNTDGRIMFRKPKKRTSDDGSGLGASSKKKKDGDSDTSNDKDKSEKKKSKDKSKKTKNTKLLSFNEDEEEED